MMCKDATFVVEERGEPKQHVLTAWPVWACATGYQPAVVGYIHATIRRGVTQYSLGDGQYTKDRDEALRKMEYGVGCHPKQAMVELPKGAFC